MAGFCSTCCGGCCSKEAFSRQFLFAVIPSGAARCWRRSRGTCFCGCPTHASFAWVGLFYSAKLHDNRYTLVVHHGNEPSVPSRHLHQAVVLHRLQGARQIGLLASGQWATTMKLEAPDGSPPSLAPSSCWRFTTCSDGRGHPRETQAGQFSPLPAQTD